MKLAVIFGGISSEHDISCLSAASILRNLDKSKYEIHAVGITHEGKWYYLPECDADAIESGAWENRNDLVPALLPPDRSIHGLVLLREGETEFVRLDCVFPVLHGVGGEDGTMQGVLELAGIPYVGCGVAASANTMDKSLTKKVVEGTGVRQARYYLALACDFACNPEGVVRTAAEQLGSFPVFVKPCSQGSSVGVAKANNMPACTSRRTSPASSSRPSVRTRCASTPRSAAAACRASISSSHTTAARSYLMN